MVIHGPFQQARKTWLVMLLLALGGCGGGGDGDGENNDFFDGLPAGFDLYQQTGVWRINSSFDFEVTFPFADFEATFDSESELMYPLAIRFDSASSVTVNVTS